MKLLSASRRFLNIRYRLWKLLKVKVYSKKTRRLIGERVKTLLKRKRIISLDRLYQKKWISKEDMPGPTGPMCFGYN